MTNQIIVCATAIDCEITKHGRNCEIPDHVNKCISCLFACFTLGESHSSSYEALFVSVTYAPGGF